LRRVARLETEQAKSDVCSLCCLVLQAGAPDTDAAALSRHSPHQLETLVVESFKFDLPLAVADAAREMAR
jgi:hypothetical protein